MFLRRRWWISCWTLSYSFVYSAPDPEQVIEVPQDGGFRCPHARGPARYAAGGTAGGSADDHFLFLVTADCGAATSTLQFLVVEDQVLVFKVFPLDRVHQRCLPPRNAFLNGLWSRSLTLFQVDVFMVLSQDKVHLLLTLQLVLENALMSLVKGVFALFPKFKKVRRLAPHSRSDGASRTGSSMDGGGSAGGRAHAGLHRVGAAQGTPRWQDLLLEQTY